MFYPLSTVQHNHRFFLLFIDNPAFTKGPKSYMQIDKNACNKPLTLDCQVNSNPTSNITWYRRRLSREFVNQIQRLDKTSRESVIMSLSGGSGGPTGPQGQKVPKINMNDFSDIFYYEPIGIGPTYTIASFNCDHMLANIKNRTVKFERMRVQHQPAGKNNGTGELTRPKPPTHHTNGTRRLHTRNKPHNDKDESKQAVFRNSQKAAEKSHDDYDEYYNYDQDYEAGEAGEAAAGGAVNEDADLDNLDFIESKNKQSILNHHSGIQSNDFGVYMCEARNNIHSASPLTDSVYYSQSKSGYNQVQRRYIKLNPVGAPVSHPVPASVNTYASVTDDTVNYLMRNSLTDAYASLAATYESSGSSGVQQLPLIEIPSSVGTSVSLTCLMEPMPRVEQIVWLRENGKIVPSSRFSIDSAGDKSLDSSMEEQAGAGGPKVAKNLKIKYENLTLGLNGKADYSSNIGDKEEEGVSESSELNADLMATNGVRSVDGNSVSLMRSMLFIKSVRREDFGIYKCKVN